MVGILPGRDLMWASWIVRNPDADLNPPASVAVVPSHQQANVGNYRFTVTETKLRRLFLVYTM